jgi:hypothetical protein
MIGLDYTEPIKKRKNGGKYKWHTYYNDGADGAPKFYPTIVNPKPN